MAADIVGLALQFIAQYGLLAIFVLLVLDGALLLPVFPGEIVLIMAVAAYAHDVGDLVFLVGLTTAAGLLGSLILYGVTRGGGRRLVERFPRFFMMPRRRRERLERVFRRPLGQSLVLFLRLIPLTRILVNIPAGLARMPIVRFVILSTVGLAVYHAAFLWFTYEANRPGSALAAQQQQLQEAYASPAWDFVQTNAIVTGLLLLVLGIILSIRASSKMYRDPEEPAGSLLGWLATLVLFWGGIALAVATYTDPEYVYALATVGGVDVPALARAVGLGPVQLLAAVSAVAILSGFLLMRVRRGAVRLHKRHRRRARAEARQAAGGETGPAVRRAVREGVRKASEAPEGSPPGRVFDVLVPPPSWDGDQAAQRGGTGTHAEGAPQPTAPAWATRARHTSQEARRQRSPLRGTGPEQEGRKPATAGTHRAHAPIHRADGGKSARRKRE